MNLPISGLVAGVAITDTDLFADVQVPAVGPVKVTALQLKTYIGNGLTLTNVNLLNPVNINNVAYMWPGFNGPAGSYLVNDGSGSLTWSSNPVGSVTSVGLATTVGLTVSGSPVTSNGVLVIDGGALMVAHGGTGATTANGALNNLLPPTGPGTVGYALFNDGVGGFYWAAAGGGGGGGGGVTTFSAGSTGFAPVAPTSGAVTLSGTLNVANGGTGATTATQALTNLLPAQGGNAGRVLETNGTTVSWTNAFVSSFSAAGTGLTPAIATNGAVSLGGTLNAFSGGTGVNGSAALNGQLLIGNGAGYSLNTLTAGTGITIVNGPGTITINSTGGGGTVTTVGTDLSGIMINNPTTTPFITGTLGYASGGTGLTAAPLNGQLPIGNGTGYTLATITAGTGITITNGPGTITIDGLPMGVTSFSGGTTGLLPNTATTGAIVLAGTLNVANGGTGMNTVGANGLALVSNGTTLVYGSPMYASNLLGGSAGQVPYQVSAGVTGWTGPGSAGTYLAGNGLAAPTWNPASFTLGTTPIALGSTVTAIQGMTGILMDAAYNPMVNQDVATKYYVDNVTQPINRLAPVDYATTPADGNQTLTGPANIDGFAVTDGMRVLVKDQTLSQEDGIYIVSTTGPWMRSTDLDQPAEFTAASVFVLYGMMNANTSWIQTYTVTTVGADPENWLQQAGLYNYNAGTGILINPGNTINNDGVLTFSGGLTGLTPLLPTKGNVTLGGMLAIGYGGTGAVTAQGARTNILPDQTGNAGKYLATDGTDVAWMSAPDSGTYYVPVNSNGTIAGAILAAGYVDMDANSWCFYNTSASTVTLTATAVTNYASFQDATATSVDIKAGKTMLLSTQVVGATYFIDAYNSGTGGAAIYTANAASSTTMAAIIGALPYPDAVGNMYAIQNTSGAPIVISGITVDDSGAFPGYTTASDFTIPAYGEALVATTVINTNYVVLNISNSVSTNLSGGSANRVVYQTGVNTTGFLPTGIAGEVLTSNGAGSPPSWTVPAGAHFIDVPSSTTVSGAISVAMLTDVAGAVYVLYNSSAAPINITTTTFDNYLSFAPLATATTVTLQAKETVTIVTDTVGTNYSIIALSPLSTTAAITVTAGSSISSAIVGAGFIETAGMIVTILNNSASTITMTAPTVVGWQAYAPASSSTAVKICASESATFVVTTVGSSYQMVNLSSSATRYGMVTTPNVNLIDYYNDGFVGGNSLILVNDTNNQRTITAGLYSNTNAWSTYVTGGGTVFPMNAYSSLVLTLRAGTVNNWDIVAYHDNSETAYFKSITAALTLETVATATNPLVVGAVATVRNNSVTTQTITTGKVFMNQGSYSDFCPNATTFNLPAGSSVSFNLTNINQWTILSVSPQVASSTAFASNGGAISAILTAGGVFEEAGQIISIQNIALTTVNLTGTITGWESWTPCASASSVRVPVGMMLTLRVVTPGSAYYVLNLETMSNIASVNANTNLSTYINGTAIAVNKGNTVTLTNTAATNITISANAFGNFASYSNASTNSFTMVANSSATFMLNSGSLNNWTIIGYDAPAGTGVGSVAFKVTVNDGQVLGINTTVLANGVVIPFQNTTSYGNFNPQGYYNPTTGRFQPLVAGYYQVEAQAFLSDGTGGWFQIGLRKNGTTFVTTAENSGTSVNWPCTICSSVIYMNGSTDYLEVVAACGFPTKNLATTAGFQACANYFSAALVTQQNVTAVGINAVCLTELAVNTPVGAGLSSKLPITVVAGNDPNSWFVAANNSIRPTIAGWYQVNAAAYCADLGAIINHDAMIVKNGDAVNNCIARGVNNSSVSNNNVPTLVYMNGSTDFLQLYFYNGAGTTKTIAGVPSYTYLNVALIGANTATTAVTPVTFASSKYEPNNVVGPNGSLHCEVTLDTLTAYYYSDGTSWYSRFGGAGNTAVTVYGNSSYIGGVLLTNVCQGQSIPASPGTTTIPVNGAYTIGSAQTSAGNYVQALITDATTRYTYRIIWQLHWGYSYSTVTIERLGQVPLP